jgi:hypothetical protein
LHALAVDAREVLDENWQGRYTIPAAGLYPHQWSWDSAFHAIGYAHFEPERARTELVSLFAAQWKNGLLPSIVFDPQVGGYFPGPDVWEIERSREAPSAHRTTGIVQPPVHATAALHLHRHSPRGSEQGFLQDLYPRLAAWHDYLYRERDPGREGLVYIRHPWESGRDNSPCWDRILERFDFDPQQLPSYQREDTKHVASDERPSGREYDCFVYLVELFKQAGYEEDRIRSRCPFLVQDVLFNAALCQAEADLAEIAAVAGRDPAPHRKRSEGTARALSAKLWSPERRIYLGYDLVRRASLPCEVAAGFLPLYAGVPREREALQILRHLDSRAFCRVDAPHCYAIASYDREAPGYRERNYWRGPIWMNINWFLALGLERYGFHDYHRWVLRSMVELPLRFGFREYYDPENGRGHGAERFSWSAALVLDVIRRGGADLLPISRECGSLTRSRRHSRPR